MFAALLNWFGFNIVWAEGNDPIVVGNGSVVSILD